MSLVIHGAITGTTARASVKCATISNITIPTSLEVSDIIDGVVLAAGDRVLVKNQTTATENGVYQIETTPPTIRAPDFDENLHVGGAILVVREGTVNKDTIWTCTTDPPNDIVSINNLVFRQIAGNGVDGNVEHTGFWNDNRLIRTDGTDGISIQESGVTLTDNNDMQSIRDLSVDRNAFLAGYMQFAEISAPANPANTFGRLYKKTGDDGLFWKPDSAGAEVDLTTVAIGETNTASNVGAGGVGLFKVKSVYDLQFKNINAGSSKISITDDVANNEVDIDVVPGNIPHDNLYGINANEHINHSTVSISGGIGLSGGGDITANRTIDLDIPELTIEGTVDPANDHLVMYDASAGAHRKILVSSLPGAAGGEVNTASNVGVGGVGLFKVKSVYDLQFKNINAGSNKISITDDIANNEVDINVVEGNINHDALLNFVSNEHIDHSTVSISGGIGLSGGGDLTANRTIDLDIPELTAETIVDRNADFVVIYDTSATAHRKVLLVNLATEATTASNIGTGGVGVFKQKVGDNLEFKKINNAQGIQIIDDVANNEVDVGLDIPQLTLDATPDVTTDHIATYDASATSHKKILLTSIVTASNIGVGGVGVFKQKTGANLEFKTINNAEGIQIINDVANNEIDVGLDIPQLTADGSPVASTDLVATYDTSATAHKKVLIDNLALMTNVGVAGVGVYKQKTNTTFELKKVNKAEGIQIIDDVANNEVDVGLDINSLPLSGAVDPITDFLAIYDTSTGLHKKVTIDSIVGGSNIGTFAIFRDEKPIGTDGGTFTSGVWQTRTLNVQEGDLIGIGLTANVLTLPAGEYAVTALVPAYAVQEHAARLWNVTDGVVQLSGVNAYTRNTVGTSSIIGFLSLLSSTQFRIEHRCGLTENIDGFGRATGFSDPEVYTVIQFVRRS